MLVRQPFQAFATSYRGGAFRAPNALLDQPPGEPLSAETLRELQRQDIERLARFGLI
jgi:hypothetical protein